MARKDVIDYFLQQQNVYFEMINNVKELELARKQNILTDEQVDNAMKDIEIVKADYERLAYIVMLLNQPKRKSKKEKEYKQNQTLYNSLVGASKEAVLDESKDALADLKIMLKAVKEIE